MAEVLPEIQTFARIKVCGVGGGGTAAIERMIAAKLQGIEFVAINTDAQALHHSKALRKVHIGKQLTRGLGAGADPEVGKKAALESEAEIRTMVKGSDMVFITLGAGGGTGSGAAPLVAQTAREAGALVVAIATKPFAFEGERRRKNAENAIAELGQCVDTLITIPNDRLLEMIDRKTPLLDAFRIVDAVLQQGVQGISDLITVHGLINLDFADVKTIMKDAGSALMGIGYGSGDDRAVEAAKQAIASPLLEVSIHGATGVLFNITGGKTMTMHEVDQAAQTITAAVDPSANIIFGAVMDEAMEEEIKITVVATGFENSSRIARLRTHEVDETDAETVSVDASADEVVVDEAEEEAKPAHSFFDSLKRPFIDESKRSDDQQPAVIAVNAPSEAENFLFSEIRVTQIEPEIEEKVETKESDLKASKKGKQKGDEVTRSLKYTSTAYDEEDINIPAFLRKKNKD